MPFGDKPRKSHYNTRTKHTNSNGRNEFGTREDRHKEAQDRFQEKKKIAKIATAIKEENKQQIDQLNKQLDSYKSKLKQVKHDYNTIDTELRDSIVQQWKQEDMNCSFGDASSESDIDIDTNIHAFGKKDGQSYDFEIKLACLHLRCLGVPCSSIPQVIETSLSMYGHDLNNYHIPNASTIGNWIRYEAKEYSDTQCAHEFLHGKFQNMGNTMQRDGSSYHGRGIEVVIGTNSAVDRPRIKNKFNHLVFGVPQIASKDAETIGAAVVSTIAAIDDKKEKLSSQSDSKGTILNQLPNHVHDGANNETATTRVITRHQTIEMKNWDYDCLQHGLAALAEGLQVYITQFLKEKTNPNIEYTKGIYSALRITTKLFAKDSTYAHNKKSSINAYIVANNLDNNVKDLYKYPETRAHHVLPLIKIFALCLSTFDKWIFDRNSIWDNQYKDDMLLFIRCKHVLQDALLLSVLHNAAFELLERDYINHKNRFLEASQHFLKCHEKLLRVYNAKDISTLNLVLSGAIMLVHGDANFLTKQTYIDTYETRFQAGDKCKSDIEKIQNIDYIRNIRILWQAY